MKKVYCLVSLVVLLLATSCQKADDNVIVKLTISKNTEQVVPQSVSFPYSEKTPNVLLAVIQLTAQPISLTVRDVVVTLSTTKSGSLNAVYLYDENNQQIGSAAVDPNLTQSVTFKDVEVSVAKSTTIKVFTHVSTTGVGSYTAHIDITDADRLHMVGGSSSTLLLENNIFYGTYTGDVIAFSVQ